MRYFKKPRLNILRETKVSFHLSYMYLSNMTKGFRYKHVVNFPRLNIETPYLKMSYNCFDKY